jgi:hypothetical protein
VQKVVRVDVGPSPGTRDRVDVLLQVLPARDLEPLLIGPLTLEL